MVVLEEAKTQVASLQKELFEIADLKTLTTKVLTNEVTFSHPHKLTLLCKVLFLYSFKYKCLFKFLEKNFEKPSANFEAFRHIFYSGAPNDGFLPMH